MAEDIEIRLKYDVLGRKLKLNRGIKYPYENVIFYSCEFLNKA